MCCAASPSAGALAPLLVIATTRPEFRAPWGARSHHGTITLAPLDRAQVRQLIGEIAARNALSREVIEGVSERTGGVPLFVEEVTRLLLERGEQGGGVQAIPPTLQQSLAARLDRLGPAREVAMIGAVLGRGFSFSLLRAVAGMEDPPLQQALERLAEADILLVEGLPPQAEYRFKHTLIQDAAYENLLKSRRQALHRRAAEILRDQFPDSAAAQPEALAHHFTQAGMSDEAIQYWELAGDQALRRSAFQEAISHLGKAIETADKPGSEGTEDKAAEAQRERRLHLQLSYSLAMMWSKGFAADETLAAYSRARELAAEGGADEDRYSIYYGHWVSLVTRGKQQQSRATAEAFLADAAAAGKRMETAVARRVLALSCFVLGDFAQARFHASRAIELDDPARSAESRFRFGVDCRITALSYLAFANWQIGEVDEAARLFQEALTQATTSRHVQTIAQTGQMKAHLDAARGDAKATDKTASMVLALSREHGMQLYVALSEMPLFWAQGCLGDRAEGASKVRRTLANYMAAGNRWFAPFYTGLLAELDAADPSSDETIARIDAAIALAQETGERWADSMLHRIRGEILLKRNPANPALAEDAFQVATAVACEQGARSFELRAALALAKLYQSTGRLVEAHDVLAPALEGFSPTPEMPEIEEAQALLAALA
jgi:predicted ATPase